MSQNKTLFSIITPAYNREKFIGKTIESVLGQRHEQFELIIVDDGSIDRTSEVVSSYKDSRIKYYKGHNVERAAARNFGLSKATGIYITFLDSDDLLRENHLSTAAGYIEKNQWPEMFHLGYDIADEHGNVIKRWTPLPSPVNDALLKGNYLSCLGVFVKREILDHFRFNENRALSGSEDYELWMRLAARYDILTFPVSTALLIDHTDRSVVTASAAKLKSRIEVLKSSLYADTEFIRRFGSRLKEFNSYLDLYVALHLLISKQVKEALYYWTNSFVRFPFVIFSIRFWVIAKKLIFH